MNILAMDIGNSTVEMGLFLDGRTAGIETLLGADEDTLRRHLETFWQQVPVSGLSKEQRRDGVIVGCSVKPEWTERIERLVQETLGEKVLWVGRQIPLPMPVWTDQPEQVGTDRVVAAAAAYDVVGHAVAVADLGTALTVDLIDDNGVFQGGVILPGLTLEANSLHEHTALLPQIEVTSPTAPFGKNTRDAINCGIYYGMIGALQEIVRRYAEHLGTWPQTVITGSAAAVIQRDCEFIDNHVPHLVLKGLVLAYRKYWQSKTEEL